MHRLLQLQASILLVDCAPVSLNWDGQKRAWGERGLFRAYLISSTLVAFAIAAFTLSASSLDISRPALKLGAARRGSSVVTAAAFVDCVETVDDIESASAVGKFSAVRKRDFAAALS
jgi:hypothetical protein